MRSLSLALFDELNNLQAKLVDVVEGEADIGSKKKGCEDLILDYLVYAYAMGRQSASADLNVSYADESPVIDEDADLSDIDAVIFADVDGKTFVGRVDEYVMDGSMEEIMRVASTEGHRVFEESAFRAAQKLGATEKRWVCLFINSRDTHIYLHGTKVPLDADFYAFDGCHAAHPGAFKEAHEDVNCMCHLEYS